MSDFNRYLSSLDDQIKKLPKVEREDHIEEIKDDLLLNRTEVINKNGFDVKRAEKFVLSNYIDSQQLANQILQQHDIEKDPEFFGKDFNFISTIVLFLSSMLLLPLPIYFGELTQNLIVTLSIEILIFSITFYIFASKYVKALDEERVKHVRFAGKFMFVILAVPFGAYGLNIAQTSTISLFSTVWFIGYLCLWLAIFCYFRKVFKSAF